MEEKKRRKVKTGLIVFLVILGLLLSLLLAGFLVMKSYLRRIDRTDTQPEEIIAPENEFFDVDEPQPELPPEPEVPAEPEIPPAEPETPAVPPVQEPELPPAEEPQTPELPPVEEPQTPEPPVEPETPTEPAVPPQPVTPPAAPPAVPSQPAAPAVPAKPAEPKDPVVLDPESVQWGFIDGIEDDHLINILLVGQDRPHNDTSQYRQRADTVILCSINPETGAVSLISFLRDLYVRIPGGYSDNRLNATYVFGGFKLLDETLTKNFGISIDGNFEVDMAGFEFIIDLLGGVEVELSAAEARYLTETFQYEGLQQGNNLLDGKQALNLARIRVLDSDFGRTGRQRRVLQAVFRKTKEMSKTELLDLAGKALPYLRTDLSDTEIVTLIYRLVPLLPKMQLSAYSVPSNGTYSHASIRGMSVLLPDSSKIRDLLESKYLPLN